MKNVKLNAHMKVINSAHVYLWFDTFFFILSHHEFRVHGIKKFYTTAITA